MTIKWDKIGSNRNWSTPSYLLIWQKSRGYTFIVATSLIKAIIKFLISWKNLYFNYQTKEAINRELAILPQDKEDDLNMKAQKEAPIK